MGVIILAIGLVLLIEGLAYVLAPSLIERVLEMLRQLSVQDRRTVGALAATLGVILIWIAFELGW